MTNLLEKIFGTEKREKRREDRIKEIEEVVDQLAYKWSLPQTTVSNIILTWQNYEHKVFGLEFK